MRRKYLWLMLGLTICVLAGTAGTAGATTAHALTFGFENVNLGAPSPECPALVVTFDLVSSTGSPLGAGSSCVQSVEGTCGFEFPVGCRQRVDSILTLTFAGRGVITARATLWETMMPDFRLLQIVMGRVTGGSGDFAAAAGGLVGVGKLAFNPDGSTTYDGRWKLLLRS